MSDSTNNKKTYLHASSETIENLGDDVQYLWMNGHNIPILDKPPSKFVFLRDYVSKNIPCIIRNAITTTTSNITDTDENDFVEKEEDDGTEAPLILTLDDIVQLLTSSNNDASKNERNESVPNDVKVKKEENEMALPMLTVDVTPDGHGDCIRTVVTKPHIETNKKEDQDRIKMFVKPCEEQIDIISFRDQLRLGRKLWKQQQEEKEEEVEMGEYSRDEEGFLMYPIMINHPHHSYTKGEEQNENEDKYRAEFDNNNEQEENQAYDKEHPYPVLYYSRQNDCLRTELQPLFEKQLFPSTFHFAQEAFGVDSPDAINIWIGDERATSSMHKDHYENLFYVLSGEKVFTLCPPSDAPFLYEEEFLSGTFDRHCRRNGKEEIESKNENIKGKWVVVPDYNDEDEKDKKVGVGATQERDKSNLFMKVRWILPDVDNILPPPSSLLLKQIHATSKYNCYENINKDDSAYDNTISDVDRYKKRYPLIRHTHPIRVSVKEGEMLYLPSLWYHRVTQTTETVGINYWYDMRFDSPQWCYFNFMQQLKASVD